MSPSSGTTATSSGSWPSRDIKVRYKQTVLGVVWAILQPVAAMLIFTLFVGKLVKVPGGVPYPVFAYCALLPWQLFSQSLTQAGNSLIENERLVTKVYFPRLLIPFAAVLSGLLDLRSRSWSSWACSGFTASGSARGCCCCRCWWRLWC